ncbi:hypothetical protein MSEN_02360 [Mycolicibacter senuensis]|uniref:Uncharacterized protein n=1 Tax=Mycolicibacter senuensis TaxID=386913 RepID=A0A7I9XGB8_9MYCO|nr:hypothetical protein MSEN_02360 [Mycolicibacter senuensis]
MPLSSLPTACSKHTPATASADTVSRLRLLPRAGVPLVIDHGWSAGERRGDVVALVGRSRARHAEGNLTGRPEMHSPLSQSTHQTDYPSGNGDNRRAVVPSR